MGSAIQAILLMVGEKIAKKVKNDRGFLCFTLIFGGNLGWQRRKR